MDRILSQSKPARLILQKCGHFHRQFMCIIVNRESANNNAPDINTMSISIIQEDGTSRNTSRNANYIGMVGSRPIRSMHSFSSLRDSDLSGKRPLHKNPYFSSSLTPMYRNSMNSTTSQTPRMNPIRPFSSQSNPCPFKALGIPKNSTYAKAKTSFLKIAMKNHPDTIQQHISKDDPSYDKKLKQSVELFRKARVAFESLVEGDGGECRLKVDAEAEEEMKQSMTNEQFEYVFVFVVFVCSISISHLFIHIDVYLLSLTLTISMIFRFFLNLFHYSAWFLNETGHSNPYSFDLDPQTMREVAEAAETMGGGAERDGGMWVSKDSDKYTFFKFHSLNPNEINESTPNPNPNLDLRIPFLYPRDWRV